MFRTKRRKKERKNKIQFKLKENDVRKRDKRVEMNKLILANEKIRN